MIQNYNYYMFTPFLPPNCDKPPTIYQILESIVNPDADLNEPSANIKIKDLAKYGREKIFNFEYPLSTHIRKEDFETLILKHYMMRRINFDTVTAFRIMLDAKLNEIMPLYNKMFDSLANWNIFTDGEITTRSGTDNTTSSNTTNKTSESTTENVSKETSTDSNNTSNSLSNSSTTGDTSTSDRRYSNTPQNRITEVQSGEYLSEYHYDTNTSSGTDSSTSEGSAESTSTGSRNNTTNSTKNDSARDVSNGTDNKTYSETITKTPSDKISIMKEMQENIKSIYTLIFKDLDILFYGIY